MAVLTHLKLTQYKNYRQEGVSFSEKLNFVYGLNGMGKTNLLDAIYYLCIGKSYFNSREVRNVGLGFSFFRLEGRFIDNSDKTLRIAATYTPAEGKTISRDETPYEKIADHVGVLPIIMVAPADLSIVDGPHSERRRFVDTTLSQQDQNYLTHLMEFNRLLKQRNVILYNRKRGIKTDNTLLAVYAEQMAEPARVIVEKRQAFFDEISPAVNRYYRQISGGAEDIRITYSTKLNGRSFIDLIRKSGERERVMGRTEVGPHRDKIILEIDGKEARHMSSQGQKKSLVLSLKVAQFTYMKIKTGKTPILAIDDIYDRLDPKRLENLLDTILSAGTGQIFISDTERHRVGELLNRRGVNSLYVRIRNGSIFASDEEE